MKGQNWPRLKQIVKDITCSLSGFSDYLFLLLFRLEQMYQVAEKIQKEVSKRILRYEK